MAEVNNVVHLNIRVVCPHCGAALAVAGKPRLDDDCFVVGAYPCKPCMKSEVNTMFNKAVSRVATEQALEDSL